MSRHVHRPWFGTLIAVSSFSHKLLLCWLLQKIKQARNRHPRTLCCGDLSEGIWKISSNQPSQTNCQMFNGLLEVVPHFCEPSVVSTHGKSLAESSDKVHTLSPLLMLLGFYKGRGWKISTENLESMLRTFVFSHCSATSLVYFRTPAHVAFVRLSTTGYISLPNLKQALFRCSSWGNLNSSSSCLMEIIENPQFPSFCSSLHQKKQCQGFAQTTSLQPEKLSC